MAAFRSPHEQNDPREDRRKKNALLLAIGLSLTAFVVQILGAFYTGSLALLGDTAHLFTDLFSLTVSLMAVTLAALPSSQARTFGFFRLEVLATFLNGILLVIVSLGLGWEAVERLQSPTPVLALPLVGIAAFGLLVNLISAYVLSRAIKGEGHHHGHGHIHDHCHDHGHGHSRDHQHIPDGDRNLRGAMLHVLSDALGSVAVVAGAITAHYTGWKWIDPLLALLLALVILRWSVRLLLDAGHVLLEGTPKHLRTDSIAAALKESDSRVRAIEDLHVWEITSRMYVATAEVKVNQMTLEEADTLRRTMSQLLQDKYGITHSVLAVKP